MDAATKSNVGNIFTIEKHGNTFSLKGGKDGKLCADEADMRCNRDALGAWEHFTIGSA
jgi:hypothetical protein